MRRSLIRALQWRVSTATTPAKQLAVKLDGKTLRTPSGGNLELPPSKGLLSQLVAQEWESIQSPSNLKPHMVPLTSLAGRAIDMTADEREKVTEKMLPYLDTDTLVVLSPERDCGGQLRRAQLDLFPPLLEDAKRIWGIGDLNVLDTQTSLFGNYQTPETKAKVVEWMNSLDKYQFAALERATTAARSLIIGMCTVLHLRPVEELAALASLDVTYQTKQWGEVEDTHDVEHADLRRLLGASYLASL